MFPLGTSIMIKYCADVLENFKRQTNIMAFATKPFIFYDKKIQDFNDPRKTVWRIFFCSETYVVVVFF